jgi:hypothetical protein
MVFLPLSDIQEFVLDSSFFEVFNTPTRTMVWVFLKEHLAASRRGIMMASSSFLLREREVLTVCDLVRRTYTRRILLICTVEVS